MMKTILLIASLLVCSAYAHNELVGKWTDNSGYGRSMYICISGGGTFHAAYSEVGIMEGKTEDGGRKAYGNWYEGGAGMLSCVTGTFELEISEDDNSISGSWECADDDDRHDIKEERLSYNDPEIRQCALLDSQGSLNGYWANSFGQWWICVDDDEYESSYSYPEEEGSDYRIPGYEKGSAYSNLIASGFFEETKEQGISLSFVLKGGHLGNFYWHTFKGDTLDMDDYNDPDKHAYNIYTFFGDHIFQEECARFSYLEDVYVYDDDDQSRGNESSEASVSNLAPAVLALGAVVLVAGYFY